MEFVGKFKEIDFYNDSLATIPEATIAAIETFGERLDTLILGGYDAKQKFREMAEKISKIKVVNLVFFPPAGKRIWKDIKRVSSSKRIRSFNVFFVDNMKDAVSKSFLETEKGKVCLLSTACPSFGVFKNYKERGELFKKYVKQYGLKKN